MLCKKKKNFTLKYYAKKKNCLDESNEMFKGTNFILEYYAKKEKNRLDESNEKKNCFENKSNESIKGTNFVLKCYAKKKKKEEFISMNRMKTLEGEKERGKKIQFSIYTTLGKLCYRNGFM